MIKTLTKYGEWIYRLLSLVGIVTILYLNSHYITVERFNAHEVDNIATHEETTKVLNSIALTLAEMKSQQKTLEDHEFRIRIVEKDVARLNSKNPAK